VQLARDLSEPKRIVEQNFSGADMNLQRRKFLRALRSAATLVGLADPVRAASDWRLSRAQRV